MSTTQAQAAVMESTARRFEQANQQLASTLSRLLGDLEALRTAWQGAGGRSFEEVKRAWAEDQRVLSNALAETATAIRTAGRRYEAVDGAAADRVRRSHRGGVDLPL